MHGRPSATADHSLINRHQHAAGTVKDCYTVVAGLGANEERVLVLARRALRPADEDRWGSCHLAATRASCDLGCDHYRDGAM